MPGGTFAGRWRWGWGGGGSVGPHPCPPPLSPLTWPLRETVLKYSGDGHAKTHPLCRSGVQPEVQLRAESQRTADQPVMRRYAKTRGLLNG